VACKSIGRLLPALVLVLCLPGPVMAEEQPSAQGMITLTYAYASDSAGPRTKGVRIGYGYTGFPVDDYPWGEFWLAYREDGDQDITAAGLAVVPAAKLYERFRIGLLVDLGFSRRRVDDRSIHAGLIGAGVEGVFRISRRSDFVSTVEAIYRTTADLEVQARIGIRFHHDKLPRIRGGS
jgi:hypothetical protein